MANIVLLFKRILRSLMVLWNAFQAINKPDLIKKSFKLCKVRGWDLSYECLAGHKIREKLRNLKTEDPEFWEELTCNQTPVLPSTDEEIFEDRAVLDLEEGWDLDDSDLSVPTVTELLVTGSQPEQTTTGPSGGLTSTADAEKIDSDDLGLQQDLERSEEETLPPKRPRKPTTRYNNFWRH